MSKRQHEVFSQAHSGRRMPQVASTRSDVRIIHYREGLYLLIRDNFVTMNLTFVLSW
jgi:hypothetical protein